MCFHECPQAQAVLTAAQTSLAAGTSAAFVGDYASRSGAAAGSISTSLGDAQADACPNDDAKTAPEACGCGQPEVVPCTSGGGGGGGSGSSNGALIVGIAIAAGVTVIVLSLAAALYYASHKSTAKGARPPPMSPRAPSAPPPPLAKHDGGAGGSEAQGRPSPSTGFTNPLLRASPGPGSGTAAAGGAGGTSVGAGALQFARHAAASRLSAKVRGGTEGPSPSTGGSATVIQVASTSPQVPSIDGKVVASAAAPGGGGDHQQTNDGGTLGRQSAGAASGRRQFKLESLL